jgi:hypothetical protein
MILLVEKYPCDNINELKTKENQYIIASENDPKCLNNNRAILTEEEVIQRRKEYEQKKKQQRREIIKCECGIEHTVGRTDQHLKSVKHQLKIEKVKIVAMNENKSPDCVITPEKNLIPIVEKKKMPPAMRATEFMLVLQKRLIDERKISENTALQYLQTLYKLNGSTPFNNLAWAKKKETVQEIINGYSPSTQNTQYAVLTSALSLFNDKATYKSCYNYWRSKMLESKKEKEGGDREKNEKQKENWIEWSDVLDHKDELKKEVDEFINNKTITGTQFDKLLNFVVVSLYTDIPPRRNEFLDMYVVKKWSDSLSKEKNYYDLATHKMIFNKYKTSKKYGVQTVDVPITLQTTLAAFFKHHPNAKQKGANDFKLLVRHDGSDLNTVNSITRILNKVFGKNIGSSMLRHSYLSAKYGDAVEDLEDDTSAMGNSPAMAIAEYIKK